MNYLNWKPERNMWASGKYIIRKVSTPTEQAGSQKKPVVRAEANLGISSGVGAVSPIDLVKEVQSGALNKDLSQQV